MTREDYYDILGVPKDADEGQIKRAYRRLAKKYHPDRNPDDDATDGKFKQVQEAYGVLGDQVKRRQYDQFGKAAVGGVHADPSGRQVYTWGGGSAVNMDDLEDLFAAFGGGGGGGGARASVFDQIFGGGGRRRRPAPHRGADIEQAVELSFEQAVSGTAVSVVLQQDGAAGSRQTLEIKIPPGVNQGQRIRVRGKGQPGAAGGGPGDLHLICRIRPHPSFTREGSDVHVTVPVTVSEAALGAKIDVPTLEGPVTMTLPPGSSGGTRLRLKGRGAPRAGGASRGDQYVTIRIAVPQQLTAEQRRLFDALRTAEGQDPHDTEAVAEG